MAQLYSVSGSASSADGTGISHVTITIEGENLPQSRSTKTDSLGNYSLENIPIGKYSIRAIFSGFLTKPRPLEIVGGGHATANFEMRPSP